MIVKDAHQRRYQLDFRYSEVLAGFSKKTGKAVIRPATEAVLIPLRQEGAKFGGYDYATRLPLTGFLAGVAMCSPEDVKCGLYSKEEGRRRALGRLLCTFALLVSPADADAIMNAYAATRPVHKDPPSRRRPVKWTAEQVAEARRLAALRASVGGDTADLGAYRDGSQVARAYNAE